ncbi:SNF1-related protein kinases, putative [Trypanosoma brucei gambiense DAL972]|uniref:Protein kinase, putative n=1 Tax=Trypanosoma brucei gambiense (strain MHOM/CI/86/DAL972) TaxID=679716 RepID=D0A2R8_TRYB9|nr:SNF1-related protein kinases, putative [Trypanosoma brucei gambiense DAL972]CBH15562.1 SNF1-related protein kinases, putative [Trypanosoma brucei gambiense DAL972]|eukprot:XP_011777826.1 SNF1-related protein kinases, putative [Trypanosoma brucei gambiense DAL972]
MSQRFGPYRVGETIGRGTFAKVKIAVHELTDTKVALKIIPRKVMDDSKSSTKLTREIGILRTLQHPNIMKLYQVVQTKQDIVLILEYVSGGELFDYICQRGPLAEDVVRHIFQQIAAGVAYCHRYRVIHRDLKPENILLEKNTNTVKIADFGLSSYTHDGRFLETSCGTPNYASPQVVSGEMYAGPDTDVWSCGVILYTMLVGALPFEDTNVAALFQKIKKAEYLVPESVSPQAHDLLRRMLVVNPLERATMEQVIQHPWVRPHYPPCLLSLHYDAILHSMRFGKSLELCGEELDEKVVEDVAELFEVPTSEVAAAISKYDNSMSGLFTSNTGTDGEAATRYPAQSFYESYANAVDVKHWPSPLVISHAEKALRDKENNMYVSYLILLQRKQQETPLQALPSSDLTTDAVGSFFMSMGVNQGYGSLTANSLQPMSLFGISLPQSLAPQSNGDALQLMQKQGNVTFCGSLPAHVQAEKLELVEIDAYMESYNKVVEPFIPLYSSTSKRTLLGKLFRVTEIPVSVNSDLSSLRGSFASTVDEELGGSLIRSMVGSRSAPASSHRDPNRLLRPLSSTKKQKISKTTAEKSRAKRVDTAGSAAGKSSEVLQCNVVAKPGFNGYMHNGVRFANIDAAATLRCVYSSLKAEGLLWKQIRPFYLAAVMHPCVKLQVRIFRIQANDQVVDVRVSSQSGMMGCVTAAKLIDRLWSKAVALTPVKVEEGPRLGKFTVCT